MDIVGPSNLETLLSTIPPYWEAGKKQMYCRMGDPTTEEGKGILRAASPLYKADQIVTAMQTKKIPVAYVLYPDEGHGFPKPNNRPSMQ